MLFIGMVPWDRAVGMGSLLANFVCQWVLNQPIIVLKWVVISCIRVTCIKSQLELMIDLYLIESWKNPSYNIIMAVLVCSIFLWNISKIREVGP